MISAIKLRTTQAQFCHVQTPDVNKKCVYSRSASQEVCQINYGLWDIYTYDD